MSEDLGTCDILGYIANHLGGAGDIVVEQDSTGYSVIAKVTDPDRKVVWIVSTPHVLYSEMTVERVLPCIYLKREMLYKLRSIIMVEQLNREMLNK